MSLGLIGALEKLRSSLGKRIEIIKGYECIESHENSKSYKKNYHTMGLASIIQCKGVTLPEILSKIIEIEEVKNVELNYDNDTVYLDTRKEKDKPREIWEIKDKKKINISDQHNT